AETGVSPRKITRHHTRKSARNKSASARSRLSPRPTFTSAPPTPWGPPPPPPPRPGSWNLPPGGSGVAVWPPVAGPGVGVSAPEDPTGRVNLAKLEVGSKLTQPYPPK